MKACQISFLLMAFCAFFFATEVVAQFRIPSDPYLPKAIGAKEFQEILSNPNRIIDTLSIESLQRKYLTRRDSPRKQIAHPVSVSFSLRDASYLDVGETGRLWYASFKLNGAIGSYLEFSNFYLAEGAQMYVYDGDRKQILGAFTSANNSTTGFFATEFLYGDSFVIEVYEKSV